MPELAEVEFYRKQWESGRGELIRHVFARSEKRLFRGTNVDLLTQQLPGTLLKHSDARGKQLLFQFSRNCWLGIHLGMTGELLVESASYAPTPHDHLVLFQTRRSLVFRDMRQFGRVLFHQGASAPDWWITLPSHLQFEQWQPADLRAILARHPKLSIKQTLLLQKEFPGIGNWMADEILWRAKIHPARLSGGFSPSMAARLLEAFHFVCRNALTTVGLDNSPPPADWLIHQRWSRMGVCPRHPRQELQRQTIGGRTTVSCAKCQPR